MDINYNPGEIEEILKRYTSDISDDKPSVQDAASDNAVKSEVAKPEVEPEKPAEPVKTVEPVKPAESITPAEPVKTPVRMSRSELIRKQKEQDALSEKESVQIDSVINEEIQKKKAPKKKKPVDAKKKRKNTIMNILLFFFIAVFLGSAGYLGYYYYNIHKAETEFDTLKGMIRKESKAPDGEGDPSSDDLYKAIRYVEVDGVEVQEKFVDLYTANKDFIGWLTVPGTNIDYPVMYTPSDEEFYLKKDFNKEKSSSGTLFVASHSDPLAPSDNVIIYGHNMKAGTMFHDLLKYEDEDYYKEHSTFEFDTIQDNGTYEVIAAFRTKINEGDSKEFKYYEFYNASSESEFYEYVEKAKSLTPYTIDTKAVYGDKLVTLSTCAYHAKEGRYVVVAKKKLQ